MRYLQDVHTLRSRARLKADMIRGVREHRSPRRNRGTSAKHPLPYVRQAGGMNQQQYRVGSYEIGALPVVVDRTALRVVDV